MLNQFDLKEILFLDIETVPQKAEFDELSENQQKLWEEKSKFQREKKELSLADSYHEAGIYAEFGKVICISVGYFATKDLGQEFRVRSFVGHDEQLILQEFAELLNLSFNNPFRMLCAHNGKEFDFPYLCRRMLINGIKLPKMLDISGKKPWEIAHLDTMELWKFGDYKHYTSIRLLAEIFSIPTPKDDIDGSQVRAIFYNDGDLSRIDKYCRKDVITVARVFQRYCVQDAILEDDVIHVFG